MLAIRFTGFVALAMLLALGLAALTLLAQMGTTATAWQSQPAAREVAAIEWTGLGERVSIPGEMTIKDHANKHNDQVLDAWKIYTYLLEGNCVASAVFCGPSDIERLYLCVDPMGRIGGLIVFGEDILTGYQGNQDYWAKKIDGPYWEVCHD